ncbi:hypothetical protein GCM10023085_45370 [Actinomadura viridis]|uniref:Siphovirus-type tail component C-terminal domain-containing protein n=1 Tax=Actinomadura viridis TaxID=58110 RepID=A0A931GK42_9ACTN|nr:phage tail domain-containing protein [Actinomadura viridis]MBG6089897.1 hypothetical protein [Actinomadura viridis]
MKTGVRLVDGARELILHPSRHILPQSLQVSSPAIRDVSESRVDDDGERDTTLLFGSRAVSLDVVVLKDEIFECEQVIDQMKSFLHPRSRPYLYVTDTGWAQERRIRLRVDQWSEPYTGYVASQAREVQLQWRAPDGVWEAAELTTLPEISADVPTTVGLTFPITFPITWDATTSTGASEVSNLGSVPSHFIARLYGPCSGPRLINETTGEQIVFTEALTLGAGEYVEIDTRDRTAYLLSMSTASRLNYLDFATTSWWRIEPGDQLIRYAPLSAAGGAVAAIEYRSTWL